MSFLRQIRFVLGDDLIGVIGTSWVVSSAFFNVDPALSNNEIGVYVNPPDNEAVIRAIGGSEIDDGFGNIVYARLTYLSNIWTIYFYSLIDSVETPYEFLSITDLEWQFLVNYSPSFAKPQTALQTFYDPTASGLAAGEVQTAIDLIAAAINSTSNDHLSGFERIISSETITIPERKQMIVHGLLTIEGVLIIQGALVMIGT